MQNENKSFPLLPFAISLAALFLPLCYYFLSVRSFTGGTFIYPLDDTYIHMEIAKNLAIHQTWGVNPGEFGSASSSPFYTLLLAMLFKLLGVQSLLPLILNAVVAVILLYCISNWLRKQNLSNLQITGVLVAVVILTPLPTLVLSGMEHTLQCLFAFLFLTSLPVIREKESRYSFYLTLIYASLLCFTRYEGLFLVGVACLWLFWKKRYISPLLIGFSAIILPCIFGLYSMVKGSYFLPNSVLVKSSLDGGFNTGIYKVLIEKFIVGTEVITFVASQRLLIFLFLFLAFLSGNGNWDRYRSLILIVASTLVLQLLLATTGWFYRYEAWLILLSVVFVFVKLLQERLELSRSVKLLLFPGAVLLLSPLFLRSAAAFTKAKQASINIYEQQYQMASFVKKHYDTSAIAANDIGALSFFTNSRIVDLWGLASVEITRARKEGAWNPRFLDSISRAKGVRLAIIYDSWFPGELTPSWKKTGNWRVENNVILGDDNVSFYAPTAGDSIRLKSELELFKPAASYSIGL